MTSEACHVTIIILPASAHAHSYPTYRFMMNSGGARRRRRRRPPTASRLKGPRKQKSLLLKRGLAKSFAYKLLKRGLANLMSPTSTSGVAPPLTMKTGKGKGRRSHVASLHTGVPIHRAAAGKHAERTRCVKPFVEIKHPPSFAFTPGESCTTIGLHRSQVSKRFINLTCTYNRGESRPLQPPVSQRD
ncbi:hypothetical protein EVAR_33808_1 [Eumeta japonica]|uniref:Uncharacterized protein n=1 Tax=Eumeta variegata TaxID=151549 RepID=A0A4C1VVS3_EUMVA|nr:hypothetical protein EVAR_33808_1 [Eumeta japonica]